MKRMIGVILAIAVAAGFAVAAQARPTDGGSLAGDRDHRSADVTFTKWVTSQPADPSTGGGTSMAGVVDGDVGRGAYAGMVITAETTSNGFWLGQALYGFYGSKHSFVASNVITEDDRDPKSITATIRGDVIRGMDEGRARDRGVQAMGYVSHPDTGERARHRVLPGHAPPSALTRRLKPSVPIRHSPTARAPSLSRAGTLAVPRRDRAAPGSKQREARVA